MCFPCVACKRETAQDTAEDLFRKQQCLSETCYTVIISVLTEISGSLWRSQRNPVKFSSLSASRGVWAKQGSLLCQDLPPLCSRCFTVTANPLIQFDFKQILVETFTTEKKMLSGKSITQNVFHTKSYIFCGVFKWLQIKRKKKKRLLLWTFLDKNPHNFF